VYFFFYKISCIAGVHFLLQAVVAGTSTAFLPAVGRFIKLLQYTNRYNLIKRANCMQVFKQKTLFVPYKKSFERK